MYEKTIPLIAALGMMGLPSCGTPPAKEPETPNKEPEKKPVQAPELVGRIASVPADKRFVLIQSYGNWLSETGQILTTRGPENRTANLKVTGEKLGEFAAADLQSGLVEVGDAVYFQHVPKPTPPPEIVEPLKSLEEAPPENVQKNN